MRPIVALQSLRINQIQLGEDNMNFQTKCELKNFQEKTVNYVIKQFKKHRRLLIADEVGLGKTHVANGVLIELATLKKRSKTFQVIYICSNASVANQNIQKLIVPGLTKEENVSDTRLSMLHFLLAKQYQDKNLIKIIPITPETSFQFKHSGGTIKERALIYAILKRIPELRGSGYLISLESLLAKGDSNTRSNSWPKFRDDYNKKLDELYRSTNGEYPNNFIRRLTAKNYIIREVKDYCERRSKPQEEKRRILKKLRIVFSEVSTELLSPDLVIMDEFQRYRSLLTSEKNSETDILTKKFFKGNNKTKILMLSATPFKLYTTQDEIIANPSQYDDHFKEFLELMKFLFGSESEYREFTEIWFRYSKALQNSSSQTEINKLKIEAENQLYKVICRTERISVMDSGDYIDDTSTKESIRVETEEIRSYIEFGKLLKILEADYSLPLDFAKSCPFLLSFMRYKLKEKIEDEVKRHKIHLNQGLLWLNPKDVKKYSNLPPVNAKLERLKEILFSNTCSELFLWVPPCKPYYSLEGVYSNVDNFSKILVFSSWEMVPRMIGGLVSYEAGRLTIGEYINKHKHEPKPILGFAVKNRKPQTMSLFTLLYPSRTLAKLYSPIVYLNGTIKKNKIKDIEKQITEELRLKIGNLKISLKDTINQSRQEDSSWYYLAPMLFDMLDCKSHFDDWLQCVKTTKPKLSDDQSADDTVFDKHIYRLEEYKALFEYIDGKRSTSQIQLGPMPKDLTKVLVNMTLGSPAVCLFRAIGDVGFATSLALSFRKYFNRPESIAVVDLSTKTTEDKIPHWSKVLIYCKNGCLQSMLDEYLYLLEGKSIKEKEELVRENMEFRVRKYAIDTLESFMNRINDNSKNEEQLSLSAHYAVGYLKDDDPDDKSAIVKTQEAFNSPFRPFVLASTSIGQEGLDFHRYCRKVMHWNLPSNPIDLEQREGRVNRYKCLAIRQNVVDKYGEITKFDKDIWSSLFQNAHEKENKRYKSDLVPFWCFGKDQKIKIERIVPMYPLSKDKVLYERLINILLLYRLTLGQPRQEEFLQNIKNKRKNFPDNKNLKKYFINLCPFIKEE